MEKKIPDIEPLLESKTLRKVILKAYQRLTPCSEFDCFGIDAIVKGAKMYAYDHKKIETEIEYYMDNSSYYIEKDIWLPDYNDLMSSYREGFRHGYFSFDQEIVVGNIDFIISDKDKIKKIFDFVNDESFKNVISITNDNGKWDNYSVDNIYEQGINRGYMYRAWYIILKRDKVFEPLFMEAEPETFVDRISKHPNPEKFAQELKDKFKKKKRNKPMALLILGLKDLGLLDTSGISKKGLYQLIRDFLGKEIGEDKILNDYIDPNWKPTNRVSAEELKVVKDIISNIRIITHSA